MSTLRLQRNVQFLYEEQLASLEARALGCVAWNRFPDDPWTLDVDFRSDPAAVLRRTAYAGAIDGASSVYADLIRPRYQGGEFNRTRSVNQYLTHWIYPYRGKFHPQMVRALLNVVGVSPGCRVLDPYVGSGTTALEAALLGVDFVGVDLSPLCVLLTRVKTGSVAALPPLRRFVAALLACPPPDPLDPSTLGRLDPVVAAFLEVARLTTLSDVARRRRDPAASFRRNLTAMLESVEAHACALARFGIEPGRVDVGCGDARDLRPAGVLDGTVDAVVTSPPYSLALDYVENDVHALDALGVDSVSLRDRMTGVRGRGAREKLAFYNADMRRMFGEVARVLRPGAAAVFVIGDATVDRAEHTTTADMVGWALDAGLTRERELRKTVFGLYSVMKDEKILFFRKP